MDKLNLLVRECDIVRDSFIKLCYKLDSLQATQTKLLRKHELLSF